MCSHTSYFIFFFNDTATTEIYTLSLRRSSDLNTLNEIKKRLSSIKYRPFELTLESIGVFSQEIIKIVWVKVSTVPLQQLIDNCLNDIFKPERRFMGHVTIARVKKLKDKDAFLKLINSTKINMITFIVREFHLKESILTKEGPIYKVINKY